jgi:hypothetical protein
MKFLNIFLLSISFLLLASIAYSAQCTDNPPSTSNELSSYITDCENKLISLKNETNSSGGHPNA